MKTIKKFLGYILIAGISFLVLNFIYDYNKTSSSIPDKDDHRMILVLRILHLKNQPELALVHH